MKIFITFFLLPLSLFAAAQNQAVTVDKRFHCLIKNENKIYNSFSDPNDNEITNAYLLVNNDTLRTIRSTSTTLHGDTLTIHIHEDDPAYDHHFNITIVGSRFEATYTFGTPGAEDEAREIVVKKSSLTLNGSTFKKGSIVRGYINYTGECKGFCWDQIIIVSGCFKAIVE